MRNSVTSGFSLSACLYFCALLVLLSVSDKAYAKRGCSAFGHSCFGGHGKRFDPNIQDNAIFVNDQNQGYDGLRTGRELFVADSENKLNGKSGKAVLSRRRAGSQQFDPNLFSLFLGQWLATHRGPQYPELEVNNK